MAEHKWVTGVITLLIGVITTVITGRGPTLCGQQELAIREVCGRCINAIRSTLTKKTIQPPNFRGGTLFGRTSLHVDTLTVSQSLISESLKLNLEKTMKDFCYNPTTFGAAWMPKKVKFFWPTKPKGKKGYKLWGESDASFFT